MVKFPDVMQVSTRHDQSVARMKLAQVDNGEHQVVLQNNLRWAQPLCNLTKDASVSHVRFGRRPLGVNRGATRLPQDGSHTARIRGGLPQRLPRDKTSSLGTHQPGRFHE